MTDENKKDQDVINQDEIVTVELGQETQTVEEEIQAVTPQVEEETTPSPEETPEKSEEVSEPMGENVEETSDVKEEVKEEKAEEEQEPQEESDEEKTSEEENKEGDKEEEAKQEEETVEEEESNDAREEELKHLQEVEAELAQLKEAEEVRQMHVERQVAIDNAAVAMDDFNNRLTHAVTDTLKQYGIDPDMSLEELQKDPAKFQIAKDIVENAQKIHDQKEAELMQPITAASQKIIFREAGKVMAGFELTEEQTKVAADTLINIFNATGLADLDADLKAKVELAVARAKMIAPKVVEVVEDVKDAVKDVVEAKAPEVKEEDVQKALEEKVEEGTKEEPEPVEEKPSLDAFKEGAIADANVSAPVEAVTKENVLQILKTLPHKDRAAFFKANQQAINEAMIEAHKRLGR